MDRIGVIGINWRQGGADELARFTVPEPGRDAFLNELAGRMGATELAYIATCNRVEIAVVIEPGARIGPLRRPVFGALAGRPPRPGEAERTFRAWAGEGAAEHLFLVTAGLDSARPGESEITGQVKDAVERSRRLGLLGSRLELVFEHALRVAGRVHADTQVADGRVSLAEIALDRLRARVQRTGGPVAVVGVSPMTSRCARSLAAEGVPVVVVNRTLARAEGLAQEVGGRAVALDAFRDRPEPVEALVSATGATDPVLDRPSLERIAAQAPSGEAPLLVDMAVPPDVDPEDSVRAGLERIGMNQVIAIAEQNRRERLVELADARALVDGALDDLRQRIIERHLSPVLAALQRRYRRTALEGVDRLLRRELKGLGEDEREAVTRWAETLARRFAHIPTAGLRAIAQEGGNQAVEVFLRGLGEELASELRAEPARSTDAPHLTRDGADGR
jgi:glutamyl-tRNA reductase